MNNNQLLSSEPNIYRYKHYKAHGYAIIKTNNCTCTCSGYFDKSVCKHLVAACIQDKIPLNGLTRGRTYIFEKIKFL